MFECLLYQYGCGYNAEKTSLQWICLSATVSALGLLAWFSTQNSWRHLRQPEHDWLLTPRDPEAAGMHFPFDLRLWRRFGFAGQSSVADDVAPFTGPFFIVRWQLQHKSCFVFRQMWMCRKQKCEVSFFHFSPGDNQWQQFLALFFLGKKGDEMCRVALVLTRNLYSVFLLSDVMVYDRSGPL